MSNVPAVTMDDLELEHAELLPSRETLWVCHSSHGGSNFTQIGYGNTAQSGLLNVAVANNLASLAARERETKAVGNVVQASFKLLEQQVAGNAGPVRGLAHLTLPSLRDRPLPLPPEGGRGALVLAGVAGDGHLGIMGSRLINPG